MQPSSCTRFRFSVTIKMNMSEQDHSLTFDMQAMIIVEMIIVDTKED
jgi:hypothetical protein